MTNSTTYDEAAVPNLARVPRALTAAELGVAARALGANSSNGALAGVAMPAGVLPDTVWAHTREGVTWRGHTLNDEACRDPETVAAWAARCWEPGDESCVPTGNAWTWVRAVRSGAGIVLWGTRELLGGPDMSADLDVPHEVLYAVVRDWYNGTITQAPAVLAYTDEVAVLDGEHDRWHISVHSTPTPTLERPGGFECESAVAEVAARVGASTWKVDQPRKRDSYWVATMALDGWIATFDVRANPGALNIGRYIDLGRDPGDVAVPEGWTAHSAAGGTVCAVSSCGLWAVLSPT